MSLIVTSFMGETAVSQVIPWATSPLGKWSVRNDQLCIELGKDDPGGGCYEVWLSGNKVELRQKNIEEPLEGVLQKPPSNR